MSTEEYTVPETGVQAENKELARRWLVEGWGKGRLDLADKIFAADFVLGGRIVGPDGPRRSVAARRASFADMTVDILLQVAEGDLVVTYFTTRARHVGPYSGVEASGAWVNARGVVIWRIRNGQVAEDWNSFDRWGVVAQIDPELRARAAFPGLR